MLARSTSMPKASRNWKICGSAPATLRSKGSCSNAATVPMSPAACTDLWYKWKRDPLIADCVIGLAFSAARANLIQLLFGFHLRMLDKFGRAIARG